MTEFYLQDFKGHFDASSLPVGDGDEIVLPDQPCKMVKLSNWSVTDVTTLSTPKAAAASSLRSSAADGQELFWGFKGRFFSQLFAGEETDWIPVNNLNQICIRSTTGVAGIIHFCWGR